MGAVREIANPVLEIRCLHLFYHPVFAGLVARESRVAGPPGVGRPVSLQVCTQNDSAQNIRTFWQLVESKFGFVRPLWTGAQ